MSAMYGINACFLNKSPTMMCLVEEKKEKKGEKKEGKKGGKTPPVLSGVNVEPPCAIFHKVKPTHPANPTLSHTPSTHVVTPTDPVPSGVATRSRDPNAPYEYHKSRVKPSSK